MFYVYIIYSPDFDRYYVGHTYDVQKRLFQHNNDPRTNKHTSKFRPWKIAKSFPVNETRGDAMKIEYYIKRMKSRKVIVKLIDNPEYFFEIAQLARVPICRD